MAVPSALFFWRKKPARPITIDGFPVRFKELARSPLIPPGLTTIDGVNYKAFPGQPTSSINPSFVVRTNEEGRPVVTRTFREYEELEKQANHA